MAKSKYDENTFPLLAEDYARQGLNDEQIAAKLGVSGATYYDYQKKYPEFLKAIRAGKKPVDVKVENALLKIALGYEYEETTKVTTTKKGITIVKEVRKVTKQVAPNERAAEFWLTNRKKKEWKHSHHVDLTTRDKDLSEEERREMYEDMINECKEEDQDS